ncbi:MAG: TolC family protein [Acidobacteriota bacterium]|jgi:outer membrane protein TolC
MKNAAAVFVVFVCAAALPSGAAAAPTPQEAGATQRADAPNPAVGTPQTLSLSLAETLRLADERSPRLGQFRARIDLATAGLEGAKSGRMPTLHGVASYSRWSNVTPWTIEMGGVPTVVYPNLPNNATFELSGSVPLYTGGRVEAEEEAAEHDISAATHDVATATADLGLQVTRSYWELSRAISQEQVLAESIEAFDAFLVDARNREELGLAARNEVLAVQTERDRAELRRVLAESNVAVLQDRLATLLDLPVGSRVEPTDELDVSAAGADLDSLVTSAFEQRPERQAALQRIAAAEAKLASAQALGKPVVAANGNLRYLNPNRREVPPAYGFGFNWDVTVGVTYDFFDGGKRDAAAATRVAEAEVARRELQEIDRTIRSEVVESYQRLAAARAGVDVAQQAIASAEENTRVTIDLYDEGLARYSDRLDAQVAELRSRLELTEALVEVALARATLDRAVGR